MTPLPLSLYLHFPWCVAKCPYCDFNSHSLQGELPAEKYVDALLHELVAASKSLADRPLISIFMGGGTPSLFPPDEIDRLLCGVRQHFLLSPDAEITMEANPGAIEHGAFAGYRAAGVNRLSLGAQSFNDRMLKALGRIHSVAATEAAFAEARAAGFDNINLDLMFALPAQSLQEAEADVLAALELQSEHISYYHLTLEPNTVFFSRPPTVPDSDAAWRIQDVGSRLLQDAGYANYEVSAWAKDVRQCVHNLNYWRFGDYLGLGAGAHGKLTDAAGTAVREVRPANPRQYLRDTSSEVAPTSRSVIEQPDLIFEFMLNMLRLRAGFSLNDFEARTGLSARLLQPGLQEAVSKRLLFESEAGHFQPSERGWRFLDDLQSIFLPQA